MSGVATKTLAVRGATWATAGIGLQRAVQTLSILVLARLLVPEDFGLVAIAVLILNLANRIKTLGLHTTLVQFEGDVDKAADACFAINGILTVVAIAVLAAVSPLASAVFDPRAGSLVAVMSLRLVPQALAAVPATLAVRALNFRKQALIEAVEGVVNAGAAIALAGIGWGPWALVAGSLIGSVVNCVLWWIRPGWAPSWRFDREIGGRLIHSGIEIWSAANLSFVIDGANRLFVGGFLGVARLGLYEIIGRIVHIPIQTIQGIHDRVALSALCREQDDLHRVGQWFVRLSGMLLVLTAPIAGSLLVFPDLLIPTLFGPGWEEAIEPARALFVFAFLAPLIATAPVYIAARRTGLLLRFTTLRTIVTVAALFVAAQISLTSVCTVESVIAVGFAPINVALAARITGVDIRSVLSTLAAPLVGLVAFVATAAGIRHFVLEGLAAPAVVQLACLLAPGLGALVLAVIAVKPHLIGEVRGIVRESFGNG